MQVFEGTLITELLELFGVFMIVLIGLELMDTVKTYITDKRIRVEAVLIVAMIAVARKVILRDLKDVPARHFSRLPRSSSR